MAHHLHHLHHSHRPAAPSRTTRARRRLSVGLGVAAVGTAVALPLCVPFRLLEPGHLVALFAGAFVSTAACVPPRRIDYLSALGRSVPIVVVTFLAIGAGDLIGNPDSWDSTRPYEGATILLFWAVLTVGWWLPLPAAATIVAATRVAGRSDPSAREECDARDPWKRRGRTDANGAADTLEETTP